MILVINRLLAIAMLATVLGALAQGDEVTIKPAAGKETFIVRGTVVEWTGKSISIDRGNGSPRDYSSALVQELTTTWPEACEAGRQQLFAGKYHLAAESLLIAARAEKRPWARRQIMTELMLAEASSGDWTTAGEMLLALAGSDPLTPAIAIAPLPWQPVTGVTAATIDAWLADKRPLAQLLGASHALTGSRRAAATQVLARLSKDTDLRIARLATAQLWRVDVVAAKATTVDNWQRVAEDWADELNGAPWLPVAQARTRLGEKDDAMLAALRPALLARPGSPVRAQGLMLAAESAAKAGHADEAQRLIGELKRDCGESSEVPRAEALLKTLQAGPNE